ncbi:MAG: ParB/RepB/Spo0J family partition protein [Clostridiales bacterium]|nr:ParB/RepB/Spo0J family partition protein [Clostridiales bacterium]
MEATRIQMLAVDNIAPHPDNPRKDLGDLTELADSIRASGILQNLTVVGWEDANRAWDGITRPKELYACVIGHRRLAAAKLAGLSHVPCVVSKMPYKQQLATMLLENLQRADLTVLEQAQGFQLMMDLGETADSIAKQTGFSRTTVYHRLNLAKLDRGKLADKVQQGATLMDLVQLEQIEDIEARNKLLEEIGGHNFNWSFQQALRVQAANKYREQWKTKLAEFAKEIKRVNWSTMVGVGSISLANDPADYTIPPDAGTRVYCYTPIADDDTCVSLFVEYANRAERKEPEETEQQRKGKEAVRQLESDSEAAWQLRFDFVRKLYPNSQQQGAILAYLLKVVGFDSWYLDADTHTLSELMGLTLPDDEDEAEAALSTAYGQLVQDNPWQAAAYLAYACTDDKPRNAVYWEKPWKKDYPVYKENEGLDHLYDWLEGLGYPISDLERDLMSGKHPMMLLEEDDDETD